MTTRIISTELNVAGVRTDDDVRLALQALYDVFSDLGLGQATFELTEADTARLFIKHTDEITVDVSALNTALGTAGDFRVVA